MAPGGRSVGRCVSVVGVAYVLHPLGYATVLTGTLENHVNKVG